MYEVTGLTSSPKQTLKLIAADGNLITITLEYSASQRGWFYSLGYLNLELSNRRLVASPNMLRQYRGVIPFGLMCNVADGHEPIYKDDFLTGRVQMYVLNLPSDLEAAEAFIAS